MAGFGTPILHGMCTYGFAVRHIQNQYPDKVITAIKGRFSNTVLPGETLITKMWNEDGKVLFEVWIKESNKKAISGGFIEFASDSDGETTAEASVSSLVTDALFHEMSGRVDAMTVSKVKGIFKFEIKQDDKGFHSHLAYHAKITNFF